jgi:hypothetical protein
MNLYNSFFFFALILPFGHGCSLAKGDKSPGPIMPTPIPILTPSVDAQAACVEKQKVALSQAGLSLTGGVDEVKKVIQKDRGFYSSLPYCSE